MHVNSPRVLVWPNQDVFKHGILSGFTASFATAENLSKFLLYCRSKGKSGWPSVCFVIWDSYAQRYFGLSSEQVELFFESCRHVTLPLRETSNWDNRLAAANGDARQRMRGKCSVNAIHLALYLYSQNVTLMQTQKFSLRSEEFPGERKAKKKGIDVRFIETFLTDIIRIIGEPESKALPLDKQSLSLANIRSLGVIFTVYTDNQIRPLDDVLQQQIHASFCGFNKLTQSFSALQVRSWLLDHIHANPFTSKRCLMHGKTVYQKPGKPIARRSIDNSNDNVSSSTLTRCRVMINDHETPEGHRMVAMQYVSRQILVLSPDTLLGHRVHLSHCNDASLYLLSSLGPLTVKQCSRSTIVTGPVAGTLYLTGCVNVRLITIARRLVLRNCHGCKVYLATPCRPLLLGGCTDITLAPHNTFYSGLQGHLHHASFSLALNRWDSPVTPPHSGDTEDKKVWQRLSPDQFHLFSIPFNTDGTTTGLVCELPAEYRENTLRARDRVNAWYERLQGLDLSDTQTNQLASVIQGRFHEWLEQTGHQREVENLIRLRDRS